MTLTVDRLREAIYYDSETGVFTRKLRLAQRHNVGDRADLLVTGGNLKGYRRVSIDSERYLAHRIAWFYVHGEWPSKDIDHINGDSGDNRLCNLRDVTNHINRQNMRRARSNSRTGLLGVSVHVGGVFRASVQLNGKRHHVGLYATPEEAHEAYIKAKRKIHEGCTL